MSDEPPGPPDTERLEVPPADEESAREESTREDSADAALIRRAKERHGSLGAVIAGGMLGLEKVFERPAKEEIPAVWEAAGEPLDIDGQGISLPVDDERAVHSRPQPPASRRVVKRRRTG